MVEKCFLPTIWKWGLKQVKLPVDVGRLPCRIDSGSTFTAEQWKNWTFYFPIFVSTTDLECWRHFVLACRRLSRRSLIEDIRIGDALLLHFCKRVCQIYGPESLTPNMHMHGHLISCIRDYGPLHAFWLFSFEQFNGLLGAQPNNNWSIKIQLMWRFLRDNDHLQLLHATDSMPLSDVFHDVVSTHAKQFFSLQQTSDFNQHEVSTYLESLMYTVTVLGSQCLTVLKQIYSQLYPHYRSLFASDNFLIPSTAKKVSIYFDQWSQAVFRKWGEGFKPSLRTCKTFVSILYW